MTRPRRTTRRTTGARADRLAGPPGRARWVAVLIGLLLGSAACQPTSHPESTVPAAAVPRSAIDAVHATLAAVNAAAGGPAAAQQAALIAHIDPARRDEARNCPVATTTVRLEPVDAGLRALPEAAVAESGTAGASDSGSAPAAAYALPTLIRSFAGDRLVGTDLTTLRLIVRETDTGDEAYLTPFCVN